MSTPSTAMEVAFTLPPVTRNVLIMEVSAFTVAFSAITLLFIVTIVASLALSLTIVARELSCDVSPFVAISSESEFTVLTLALVANAAMMELAKFGLFPKVAAISASVSNCEGAPLTSMEIFPSKYEVVAFRANPADNDDTLPFNAASVACNAAKEVEIASETDATVEVRAEISVLIAVLIAVLETFNNSNDSDAVWSIEATPL